MSPWIGVIGALLGAIIGGVIGILNSRLQLNEQRRRERDKLILTKLEELFETAHKVMESTDRISKLNNLEVGRAEVSTLFEEEVRNYYIVAAKLEMLIGFYAPELTEYEEGIRLSTKNYLTRYRDSFGSTEIGKASSDIGEGLLKIKMNCIFIRGKAIDLSKTYLKRSRV